MTSKAAARQLYNALISAAVGVDHNGHVVEQITPFGVVMIGSGLQCIAAGDCQAGSPAAAMQDRVADHLRDWARAIESSSQDAPEQKASRRAAELMSKEDRTAIEQCELDLIRMDAAENVLTKSTIARDVIRKIAPFVLVAGDADRRPYFILPGEVGVEPGQIKYQPPEDRTGTMYVKVKFNVSAIAKSERPSSIGGAEISLVSLLINGQRATACAMGDVTIKTCAAVKTSLIGLSISDENGGRIAQILFSPPRDVAPGETLIFGSRSIIFDIEPDQIQISGTAPAGV